MTTDDGFTEREESGAEDSELCPACLAPNRPGLGFCKACGCPLAPVVNYDPFKRIYTYGYLARQTATAPHSLMVVVAVWLCLGTWLLVIVGLILGSIIEGEGLIALAFGFVVCPIPSIFLWRMTSNYIRYRSGGD